jgi:hypothetical protein
LDIDAATNNLKHLAEEFGPEWAMQHIIPQVCSIYSSVDVNLFLRCPVKEVFETVFYIQVYGQPFCND